MAKKRKQTEIAGFEQQQQSIPVVEEAAEEYRALRDKRMALQKKEAAAQATLISAMNTHGVKVYTYMDEDEAEQKVVLAEITKARVRKVKPNQDDDDGDDSSGTEH